MIESLIELDQDIFLFLNGLHADWLDPIMFWISGKKQWFPFYALIIGLLIYRYKWKSIPILIGITLTIVLADQVTSGFMKPFFGRYRPSHEPALKGLVYNINHYYGGKYGFASSHAANSFGLAMFLWLLLRTHYRWISWIFLWAAIISYSRIYLGVHYPGDILVGGIVGCIAAWLMHKLYLQTERKWFSHLKD